MIECRKSLGKLAANTAPDIKPNNILLDYEEETAANKFTITSVQIADLEDGVLLPPGKGVVGCLSGNQLWRSPESWARARQLLSSDVFSFGIVAVYVMYSQMVFRLSSEEMSGEDAWWHVLRRHISVFGDVDGIKGLLRHVGEENVFFDRLIAIAGDFGPEKPREPYARWYYEDGEDAELRDLVIKMTNLDPAQRITAREALEHPWFRQAGAEQQA